MRTFFVFLTIIVISFPLFALTVTSSDEAVNLAEEALLPDGRDNVTIRVWGPVSSGVDVRGTKEFAFTTTETGHVIYIDDYPTANMFHPVRYAFVASASGKVTAVDAESPPVNFYEYTEVETEIGNILNAAQNRRAPIPAQTDPPSRNDSYAVLMNGGYASSSNHIRYWNDLSNIYITLVYTYGFPENNIITLCSDGLNPAPDQSNGTNSPADLDGDHDDDIMYACVLAAVDAVFDSLANLLTEDDKLFIFTTDHGSSNGGWSTYQNLWNQEQLTDEHFAELLDALPQCEIIFTLEPCYSGGFLDNGVVPPGPRVGSSACRYDQVSWAMGPNYVYDEYVFHWTAAVKGEDAYGVPVDADYNNDDIIDMSEAYRYAEENDQANEDPQYSDYPAGIGASLSLWPSTTGAYLTLLSQEIDDIGGNNNGAADPGETISLETTISNYGTVAATNISGTLSTTNPYLTITQNLATFPDLASFEQGTGTPAFMVDISPDCPQGENASCTLLLEADSAYTNDLTVVFVVGDVIYNPTGPDEYGYMAYDPYDAPELPQYEWIELHPDSGGLGEQVPFTLDDQTLHFALPFTFTYYGIDYDSLTIAANGWISMEIVMEDDYSNSAIPSADGPSAMIAPYWEDISPQRANSGGVWHYYDSIEHTYTIEYNHVEQFSPTGNFETFEVILFDPAHHATLTGDGIIKMQYKDMSSVSESEGTIGIENHFEMVGIQYLFDGELDLNAHPIADEFCILYLPTVPQPSISVNLDPENPPIVIPAGGASFDFHVEIENYGLQTSDFDVWSLVTLPNGSEFGPIILRPDVFLDPGAAIVRDLTQFVPGGAPEGLYVYSMYCGDYDLGIIYGEDSFEFDKEGVDAGSGVCSWEVTGWDDELITTNQIPSTFSFLPAYPNPFNPETTLSFTLPEAADVSLTVYDIQGRIAAKLVDEWKSAGQHEVTFNASGLASGIYFARIQAGSQTVSQKLLLLK